MEKGLASISNYKLGFKKTSDQIDKTLTWIGLKETAWFIKFSTPQFKQVGMAQGCVWALFERAWSIQPRRDGRRSPVRPPAQNSSSKEVRPCGLGLSPAHLEKLQECRPHCLSWQAAPLWTGLSQWGKRFPFIYNVSSSCFSLDPQSLMLPSTAVESLTPCSQ